jgi:hypothetical protein
MSDVQGKASRAGIELRETAEIMASLRQNAFETIAASPFDAEKQREKLYLFVQTIDAVKKALQAAVDAGLIEASAEQTRQILAEHTTLLRP